MKRLLLPLMLLFAATTMISCDLKEELDMLNQPIHVQGDVDPYFGVPIAEGQMTLGDVLSMLSSSYSGMIDPDSNTITIYYDAQMHDVINAGGMVSKKLMTKGTLISIDTTIGYGIDINLFDDVSMQGIVDGNIDINHMWVNLAVNIMGHCGNISQSMRDDINGVLSAVFDSLVITYIGHDGVSHTLTDIQMDTMDAQGVMHHTDKIPLHNIIDQRKDFAIYCDVAEIVNSMPRRVNAEFRMRFELSDNIFGYSFSDISYFTELMDSIKLTQLEYGVDIHVEFPFDIHIGYLPYSFTLDLGENGLSSVNFDSLTSAMGEGVDVELKDSELNLRFVNGIPMDIDIATWMLDENNVPLGTPLIADTTIAAAKTINAGDNTYVADPNNPTTTVVTMKLNSETLAKLKNTRHLRFDLALRTGTGHARIRKTDYLKVKAFVKLHPSVNIDIPLTGGNE